MIPETTKNRLPGTYLPPPWIGTCWLLALAPLILGMLVDPFTVKLVLMVLCILVGIG